MGDGGVATYDNGFYDIGVRPAAFEDLGVGGRGPVRQPAVLLASSTGPSRAGSHPGPARGRPLHLRWSRSTRRAGRCRTTPAPGSGSRSTARSRCRGCATWADPALLPRRRPGDAGPRGAFYNRGGNFENPELDPDIEPLGLTGQEKADLVAFMKSLTDLRVRFSRAPFDHPTITIFNGHPGNQVAITATATRAWHQPGGRRHLHDLRHRQVRRREPGAVRSGALGPSTTTPARADPYWRFARAVLHPTPRNRWISNSSQRSSTTDISGRLRDRHRRRLEAPFIVRTTCARKRLPGNQDPCERIGPMSAPADLARPLLTAFGLTHPGQKRGSNEDAFGTFVEDRLFIVADGMGGHSAGEVAAATTVDGAGGFLPPFHGDPRQSGRTPSIARCRWARTCCASASRSQRQDPRGGGRGSIARADGATVVAMAVGEKQSSDRARGRQPRLPPARRAEERLTRDHSIMPRRCGPRGPR